MNGYFKIPSVLLDTGENKFRTRKLREFCATNGIVMKATVSYSSYQNGTAELMDKTLQYKMFSRFLSRHLYFYLSNPTFKKKLAI